MNRRQYIYIVFAVKTVWFPANKEVVSMFLLIYIYIRPVCVVPLSFVCCCLPLRRDMPVCGTALARDCPSACARGSASLLLAGDCFCAHCLLLPTIAAFAYRSATPDVSRASITPSTGAPAPNAIGACTPATRSFQFLASQLVSSTSLPSFSHTVCLSVLFATCCLSVP